MTDRKIIVTRCMTCPYLMAGSRGFYCHEHPGMIKDPFSIPETCDLPRA